MPLTLKGNYRNGIFSLPLKTFNIELVEAINLTYGLWILFVMADESFNVF